MSTGEARAARRSPPLSNAVDSAPLTFPVERLVFAMPDVLCWERRWRPLFSALIAILVLAVGARATADEQDSPWSTGWGVFRVAKTTGFTPTLADRGTVFDCTSGTFTVNLPSAATVGSGYHLAVYDSGAGTITVSVGSGSIRTPTGTGATVTLVQGQGIVLECDGANYSVVSGMGFAPGGSAGGDLTGTYPNPTIGANKVVDADIRQGAGTTVIGRSAGTTGNVADIAAGADNTVLRRSGGTLAFGTIDTAAIGSGTLAAARMPALTGDITTSAGAVATTLKNTGPGAGSFTNSSITIDAQGRVTAASSGTISSLLYSQWSATAISNTTTPTTISGGIQHVGSLTIPANTFSVAGRILRIHAAGTYFTTGTPTLELRLMVNGNAVGRACLTPAGASSEDWVFNGTIICQTTGSSGSVLADAHESLGNSAASTVYSVIKQSNGAFTVNTTTTFPVDLMVVWSAASVSNSVVPQEFYVEQVN